MRDAAAICVAGMLVFGCSSAKKDTYERLAAEANPILLTLVPKMAVIQALAPDAYDDDPRLAAACASADSELERLSDLQFDERSIHNGRPPHVAFEAASLVKNRRSMCEDWETGSLRVKGTCRWWCLDAWSFFNKTFSDFEAKARAEGVNVFPLPQVPPPGNRSKKYLHLAN